MEVGQTTDSMVMIIAQQLQNIAVCVLGKGYMPAGETRP